MEVGCIGLCAVEPIVDVQLPGKNRVSFQRVTHDRVENILDQAFSAKYDAKDLLGQIQMGASEKCKNVPDFNKHPFFAKQKRIVLKNCGLINPESIEEYITFGGYAGLYKTLTKHTGAEICDIIEKSGLRGRGGGGFPTGRKWRIANQQVSKQKYLVCNADERLRCFTGRAVIEGDPHRLIEGWLSALMLSVLGGLCLYSCRISFGNHTFENSHEQLKTRFLGKIFRTDFSFELKIKMGAGAFVCGEETALVNSIEGLVSVRPRLQCDYLVNHRY